MYSNMSTIFSSILWNPSISPFSIFGFEVRYYALCWMAGLIAAYMIVHWAYRNEKVSDEKFEPLFVYCFLGILIGARLGHCLFYEPGYYLAHPIEMLLPIKSINGSWTFTGYAGLASHGGTIGILLALLLYIKRVKLKLMWVLDCIGLAAPIFGAFVRLGNLMNSEIIGNATDLPWGMVFVQAGETAPKHPAQLYESIAYFIFFVMVMMLYRKYRNKVGSGLFIGFSVFTVFTFRFFVEYVKDVQVSFEEGMFLNMGQILSIPLIITGAVFICRSLKWKK